MSMPACRVTFPQKRYTCPRVFVCLACNKMACAERSHAITCSPACRVWLHRHPELLRDLNATCKPLRITPAMVQTAAAVRLLLPDASARVALGEIELDDTRGELWQAYWQLLTTGAAASEMSPMGDTSP